MTLQEPNRDPTTTILIHFRRQANGKMAHKQDVQKQADQLILLLKKTGLTF